MGTFARQNFSDQLNIDTPEGVALRFPVAGIGSRGIAALVDYLIHILAALLIGLGMYLWARAVGPEQVGREMERLDTLGKWFLALVGFLLFCLWSGYFALFEAFWQGQTPGKRLLKLRVIKDSGRQITLFEAVARNVLRLVDYFPSWYVTGVITMACNAKNKRLGDLAAGTIVVHESRDDQPLVVGGGTFITQPVQTSTERWAAGLAQETATGGAVFPADALARLGPNDLLAIDTFFSRALDLPMAARETMAQRVAVAMCARMDITMPAGNPERVLEAILAGLRSGARRFEGSK